MVGKMLNISCVFIYVEGISQAEMLAFLFYAKATSQKLCLHTFMTTAREREKFAKRASHCLRKDNEPYVKGIFYSCYRKII